ncbi:hypothetical protein BGZ91_010896 [Linnemannia elongata]|nr:hypothetical protein BGZ91_010896 [Linnemannia elongata]
MRGNTRLESTWTRSPLPVSSSRRVATLRQTHAQSLSTSAKDFTGSHMKCLRGQQQHSKSLLVPLQQSCQGMFTRSTSTITTRSLMTQMNRQQDSILKYSGDNDRITPQEYKIRVGTGK